MKDSHCDAALFFDWTTPLAADIDACESEIHLSTLSFNHPSPTKNNMLTIAITALQRAAARGVHVHVYLPAISPSHPATLQNGSAADRLHAQKITAHLIPLPQLLHAKTVSLDDAVIWCGSGNWTQAAAAHNDEAYLRVCSPTIAREMRQKLQSLCWKQLRRIGQAA